MSRRIAFLVLAVVGTIGVLSFVLFQARYGTPPPARINVRWQGNLGPDSQRELERLLELTDPVFQQGKTWSYALEDTTGKHLRAIVENSEVADTHGVDRGSFVLTDPPTADWGRIAAGTALLTVYASAASITLILATAAVWLVAKGTLTDRAKELLASRLAGPG